MKTFIRGFELWKIDKDDLVHVLRQKLQVGVSDGINNEQLGIVVQGRKIKEVLKILTETFKVPLKYIE